MPLNLQALNETKNFQRAFVAIFIIYYLFRLEPYTWHYSPELLIWPKSFLSFDPVFINQHFLWLLGAWLFVGVGYLIKPQVLLGAVFAFLSYLFVGRLNSYVFILRYDFNPMAFLFLTLLLPHGKSREDFHLRFWIIRIGLFVWVSCFVTAAIAKLNTVGWSWTELSVLRDHIFYDNITQGAGICKNTWRIDLLNFIMSNKLFISILSIFILLFELLYGLVFISRRWAIGILILTAVFQLSIEYMLNVQFYNYWVGFLFWLAYLKHFKFQMRLS